MTNKTTNQRAMKKPSAPKKKSGGLSAGLTRNEATKAALAGAAGGRVASKTIGANSDRPDRRGKINITGYFEPAVRSSIRRIQVEHPELSQQDILAEALNLVFAKYRVPEAASVGG